MIDFYIIKKSFLMKKISLRIINLISCKLILTAFLFSPLPSLSQSCKEAFKSSPLSHERYQPKALKVAMNSINYKKLIMNYPRLSVEDEKTLFELYNKGDERAFQILFLSNLHHIPYVIKRYQGETFYEDLFQESLITLLKVFKTFDVNKGEFKSYLKQAITRKVILYVEKQKTPFLINWNPNRYAIYRAFRKDLKSADSKFNIESWIHNFHKENPNFSNKDIKAVKVFLSPPKFLQYDNSITDNNLTIAELTPDTKMNLDEQVISEIDFPKIYSHTKIKFLDKIDQAILEDRVFSNNPRTLESLGNDFSISYEAVRLRQSKITNYIQTHFPR